MFRLVSLHFQDQPVEVVIYSGIKIHANLSGSLLVFSLKDKFLLRNFPNYKLALKICQAICQIIDLK